MNKKIKLPEGAVEVEKGKETFGSGRLIEREGFNVYEYGPSVFLSLTTEGKVLTTCPINNSEDVIYFEVKYKVNVNGWLVEQHSFAEWLEETFTQRGSGLEETCSLIYEQFLHVVQPDVLEVTTKSTNKRYHHTAYRSNTIKKEYKMF